MPELDRLLGAYGELIDAEIRRTLESACDVAEFSAMLAYPFGYVDADMRTTSMSEGKRFRPLLCIVACRGAGGAPADAMTCAAALEILHNFSLVHDDIEDRDATRRHKPTVWTLWGDAQGINVGDGMFALAGRTILDASRDPAIALSLARRFQETAQTLTQGQYLDMAFESRPDVSAREYMSMIGKKTGSLIEMSLWSGAFLAGAADSTLRALSTFGRELGYAFQIHDDMEGIWSPRRRTGKEQGQDLKNRKKTLPVLLAVEDAPEPHRSVLRSYISGMSGEVEDVMAALDGVNARARVGEVLREHLRRAHEALIDADLRAEDAESLRRLANELTGGDRLRS